MIKKIFCLTAIVLTSACTKPLEEKPGNYGAEAQAIDVDKAWMKAVQGISIENTNPKDYVNYEQNGKLESLDPNASETVFRRLESITNSENAKYPNSLNYTMTEVHRWYNEKGQLDDEKISTVIFEYLKNRDSNPQALASADDCDGNLVKDEKGKEFDCIKYYGLIVQPRLVDAPAAVAAKPNCMGLPDCKISGQFLSYTQAKWIDGKTFDAVTLEAHFSPQVPDLMYTRTAEGIFYLPAATSICQKGHAQSGNTNYMIRSCLVLRDFGRSTAPEL